MALLLAVPLLQAQGPSYNEPTDKESAEQPLTRKERALVKTVSPLDFDA